MGYVWNDGPKSKGGKRYTALTSVVEFVEKEDMTPEERVKHGFLSREENLKNLNFLDLPAVDIRFNKINKLSKICQGAKAILVVNLS